MAILTGKLTIEDFERLPQEEADFRELVDGELVDVSGNTPQHNWIRDGLIARLKPIVAAGKLGMVIGEQEYDFGGNAHGPDLSFFGLEKLGMLEWKRRVQRFVPDLAVEVASPNDTYSQLRRKKKRYRDSGTAEVWLIEPEAQEVTVCTARGEVSLTGDDELSTPLIPGFRIKVSELFEL
ncbi:MAG: Uma2 family endonuclease [Bryobacteraceae bacterium]|nr:Uma2 family endonuclease [Bryobacteraceae bacterium]